MKHQEHIIDLSYVKGMAGGNIDLVREMIDIFLAQIPEFLAEMRSCYEKEDWYHLGLIAHKAKSSVAVMGMEQQAMDLRELEMMAKEAKSTGRYEALIDRFEENCNRAIEELNKFKSSDS